MRIIAGLSCGLVVFGSLTLVAAPVSAQTVPEYDAVRAARPDGRTILVNGLGLVRDVDESTFARASCTCWRRSKARRSAPCFSATGSTDSSRRPNRSGGICGW